MMSTCCLYPSLHWRHNGHDGVSNHQPSNCLLNRLLRRRSKKKSKLRVTGLCAGNSPVTGEFPAQRASNAENVSIWWRHHVWVLLPSTGPEIGHHCACRCPGSLQCWAISSGRADRKFRDVLFHLLSISDFCVTGWCPLTHLVPHISVSQSGQH